MNHQRRGSGFAALLLLAGCAGLYNQPRVDRAKEAQTTFAAAKLAEALNDERAQSETLHARELDVVEKNGIAIRDAELLWLIGKAPKAAHGALRDLIAQRLGELGGGGARLVAAKQRRLVEDEANKARDIDNYLLHRSSNDPEARCSDTQVAVTVAAKNDWTALQQDCGDIKNHTAELDAIKAPGEFDDLRTTVEAIEGARTAIQTEIVAAARDFEAAKQKLTQEHTANKPVDLTKAAKDFKEKLENVKVPNASKLPPGIDRVRAEADVKLLEELQKHVGSLLEAAAKEPTVEVPTGVDDDLQIARVLPGLAAQLNAGLKYPRVSALVLQSEHLRLELERARNDVARVDQQLALLRAKRALMVTETRYLSVAQAKTSKCSEHDLSAPTFAKLPPECNTALTAALIAYANSWTSGRIPAERIDWDVIQLRHESSFDQSVTALAEWQNLIGVPLQALVTSYESGVKAQDIGQTLNAVGLGSIAVGVH